MAIITLKNNSLSNISSLPASIPTGKILQVVQSTTQTNITTSSTTYQNLLTANITPSSTSSKIFILTNVPGRKNGSATSNNAIGLRIRRDTTQLIQFGQYISWNDNNTVYEQETASFDYIDTPSSSSQITYSTQIKSMTGGEISVCHDSSAASLTLMEVAG